LNKAGEVDKLYSVREGDTYNNDRRLISNLIVN